MALPTRAVAWLGLIIVLGTVLAGKAVGAEIEHPQFIRSFGPDGTDASAFGRLGSVAVDQGTGSVYAIDQNPGTLLRFDVNGQPENFTGSAPYLSGNRLNGLSIAPFIGESQVAVDAGTQKIYVTDGNGSKVTAFEESGEPSLFTAGPGAGTNELSVSGAEGIAVDQAGNIYVAEHDEGRVKVIAPSGEPVTEFTAPSPANLAVDSEGIVYAVGGGVRKFIPSESPVTSSTTYVEAAEPFDSIDSMSVAVDPVTNDVYVAHSFGSRSPEIAWYDKEGMLLTTFAGAGEAGALLAPTGVAVNGLTRRVFVGNEGEEEASPVYKVEIFGPEEVEVGPPFVGSPSVIGVSARGATLSAVINPNTFETTYHFEYGPADCSISVCSSAPVPDVAIGGGHKPVVVSQTITGLAPGTTYHYRVVAINHCNVADPSEECVVRSSDRTFNTQVVSFNFQLADHRTWEMVSPPDKFGAKLLDSLLGLVQAAADGNGLVYVVRGSIEPEVAGNRSLETSSILARREDDGWHSKDITPPHTLAVPFAEPEHGEYKLFTPNLGVGLLRQRDDALLSPDASERTPYLRENTEPPTYTPLVTGREGVANVPPGTEFGGDLTSSLAGVSIAGATPDLSHVVLRSEVPLVFGAQPSALYEWAGGQLRPVSVLPEAEGGAVVHANEIGSGGTGAISMRGAISRDGSLVFWSPPGLPALYVRDMVGGTTVRLDQAELGAGGGGAPDPIFQAASSDGSVVFFTDRQHLTTDASPSGSDLYRCEISLLDPSAGCVSLTNITGPQAGPGESAKVQGLMPALSEDGGALYLVAEGVLDPESNEAGEVAAPKQPNLYRWREGEGFRYIATLSKEDSQDWGVYKGLSNTEDIRVEGLAAAGSPNGRFLSFMSARSLTGYDNRGVESGEPAEEVFVYDSSSERLSCVSCNPTGGRPGSELSGGGSPIYDPHGLWEGRRLAATVPESTTSAVAAPSFYQPRYVLNNGRVFFNSVDSLVPADSNGQWDVYEYEPTGIGDCSGASVGSAVSRSAGGCVALLSSGTGGEAAGFLDASESGDDVFFLTPAQLNEPDQDQEYDVYDARVNGVPATLPTVAECLGEACQPNPAAPNDPTPSSVSFQGKGNVKGASRKRHCAKDRHRVRHGGKTRCVPSKHQHQKRRAGKHGKTGGGR